MMMPEASDTRGRQRPSVHPPANCPGHDGLDGNRPVNTVDHYLVLIDDQPRHRAEPPVGSTQRERRHRDDARPCSQGRPTKVAQRFWLAEENLSDGERLKSVGSGGWVFSAPISARRLY